MNQRTFSLAVAGLVMLLPACDQTPAGLPPGQPESDVTAPQPPTEVDAAARGSGAILVSWTAAIDDRGVAKYEIRRGTVAVGTVRSGFVLPGSPVRFSFLDEGLAASTTYVYAIVAIDFAGNRSVESALVTARTAALLPGKAAGGEGGADPA